MKIKLFLHFFRTENKLKSHEKACKRKIFAELLCLLKKKKKKSNQCMKSNKMPYIIYADIESLIQKIDNCKNNPGKSFTAEIGEHISWGYSMSTIWLFDHIERKHSLYCRKDSMKKLWIFKRTYKKYNWFWKEKIANIKAQIVSIEA